MWRHDAVFFGALVSDTEVDVESGLFRMFVFNYKRTDEGCFLFADLRKPFNGWRQICILSDSMEGVLAPGDGLRFIFDLFADG
jgi:hypothetical protein